MKSPRVLPILCLITVVSGCVGSRQVTDTPCPDYETINARLEGKRAFVYLPDYTRARALDVRMMPDSTFWLRPDSTEGVVASSDVVGIEVRKRSWSRLLIPALPLAAYLIPSFPWSIVGAYGLFVTANVLTARRLDAKDVYGKSDCD